MALADAVRDRAGQPLEPAVYKKMYLDRLYGSRFATASRICVRAA